MEDLPLDQENSTNNQSISGFAGAGGSGAIESEPEVSLSQQIPDGVSSKALEKEVENLLSSAVSGARASGMSDLSSPDAPASAAPVDVIMEQKLGPSAEGEEAPPPTLAFNALAAFVAGLAVVGVVYAFAVKGGFDQYRSSVLGEKIEASK